MPDMQTALKEALNEWSDSAGRHQVEKQQPTPLPEVPQMQTTPTPRGAPTKPENETARREIFYHIKGNPNSSLQDLADCGFDSTSASTHLSILYFNGKLARKAQQVQRPIHSGRIATRDVFVYSAAVAAMLPNKKAKKIRVHKKIKQGGAAQPAQGIAALPTEQQEIKPSQGIMRIVPTPQPETASPIPANITAEYVIKHISLSEAVKLHAELKKMLG